MPRSAIFSLVVIGGLVLTLPVVAQPLRLTSNNGCDVYEMVDGGLEFQPYGHVGSLSMQKVSGGEPVAFVFECIDFAMEPEIEHESIQQSRSICNWRMQRGGRGTTRAEVRWFPDSQNPGGLAFSVNAQVIRGNRYLTGVTSAQGRVDQAAGTIDIDSFVAVFCDRLKPRGRQP